MSRSTKIKSLVRRFRMFIAEKHLDTSKKVPDSHERIYHVHIRKSAGSSINNLFYLKGDTSLKEIYREPIYIKNGYVFVQHHRELIEKGNYYFASSHFPVWDLNLPPGTFTFTVLRHPLERLFSLYKYYCWVAQVDPKVGMKSDPSFQTLIRQHRLLNKPFKAFVGELSNKYLYAQLFTFDKDLKVEAALEQLSNVNRVYFFDHINTAIKDLCTHFDLPVEKLTRERQFKNVQFQVSEADKVFASKLLKDEILFYHKAKETYR